VDLLGSDVLTVGQVGELVEGPDLHGRDAHLQQLLGQDASAVLTLPLEQIFVWSLVLADPPAVGESLTWLVALEDVVSVARAGVVQPDAIAHGSAQAPVDRQADALAEEV